MTNSTRIFDGLTPVQADGPACVVCDADYLRVRTPSVPVGRSQTGSQVLACHACAVEITEDTTAER